MKEKAGNKRRQIGAVALKAFIVECSKFDLLPGAPPAVIDWRRHDHPYKARYGDKWFEEIKKSKTFKGTSCITEMIEHIWTEAEKFFSNTSHKDTWWVYHDALSIMCEKGCIEWMREKGYLQRWILPELGLNDDIGSYGGRPVGNCPEYMPWDSCLNKDVHETVRRHCVLSRATLSRD